MSTDLRWAESPTRRASGDRRPRRSAHPLKPDGAIAIDPPDDPASFAVKTVRDGERLVIAPTGDVDLHTADELRRAIADALDQRWSAMVIDLRAVTFMDGQGAHVLLDARAASDAAGVQLALVDGRPSTGRVLELLELRPLFRSARQPVPRAQ